MCPLSFVYVINYDEKWTTVYEPNVTLLGIVRGT